jgi:uroporphyrinogen decarboxylase
LREQFPSLVLQGNLDPIVLLSHPEQIIKHTKQVIDMLPSDPAYIFNLGHGILPSTPPEAVQTVIETVRSHYPAML